jgi:murein DD-endopeptidase MepM/ murein hydrolase activator NlpD
MTNPVPGYGIGTPYGQPGSWAAGYHTGNDYPAPSGATVVATRGGKVTKAQWDGDYGNRIEILTGDIEHSYSHLSDYDVSVGEQVSEGQPIGNVGSTGNSTGPHLHYEERTPPHGYSDDREPQFDVTSSSVPPTAPPGGGAGAETEWLIEGVIDMSAVTVTFFHKGGTVYEADLIAGTYRGVANPADLEDRKHVLNECGIRWTTWRDGAEVGNPEAFGVRI